MTTSTLIRVSRTSLGIFKLAYLVFFLFFLGMVVSWFIDNSLWENIDISSGFKAGFGMTNIQFSPRNMPEDAIVLGATSHAMMGWLLLRNTIFFCLGWIVLQRISRILNSIESIDVFYVLNIESFKTIGKVCFVIAGFSAFNFYIGPDRSTLDFTLPLMPVLFGFGSLVLAEVFKQGRELTEDKNSIV